MSNNIPDAKLLRKKLKNGLIVDKWDLVNLIEQQQDKLTKYELRHAEQRKRIEELEKQLAFMEGEYPEPTIMAKMMEVDLVRQQQAEIEALKWAVNHREQDVDALKTKLNDVKYKYDIKIHQHVYTQVYVDELQAEIEALKAKLAQIAAEDKKLFEAVQKANDIWDRATGRKP